MSAVPKYLPHYTVDDYLQWEGDWELWQGIPVAMSPSAFGRHQNIVTRITSQFQVQVDQNQCDSSVMVELDWVISPDTVVRPDAMVICGPPPERHATAAPEVAIEVLSKSTAERDKTFKRDLYESNGVGVYLLLDPDVETMQVYRRDDSGNWESVFVDDTVRLQICDDCTIELSKQRLFGSTHK